MTRALRLRHVGIVVSDLEQAITLFQEYLGCELINHSPVQEGDYISRLVGISNAKLITAILRTCDNNRIELLEYISHCGKSHNSVAANNVGVSHFAITVENIQELYKRSSDYGVRFLSPPINSPDGFVKVAYAVLMDECMVELVEVLDTRAAVSGGIL
jgi:catechol 2,3-dioxygenase-like lactoylglutathione lyase family enzyme